MLYSIFFRGAVQSRPEENRGKGVSDSPQGVNIHANDTSFIIHN
jgi:hypothetical protein